jgi:ATP-binding cassette subfamily C protein
MPFREIAMDGIIEKISSRTIKANGSNPIVFDSPDRLYYVKKNIANIFVAPYKDNEIDGYAKYLFELKEGQLLLGATSYENYSMRLSGIIGTEIVEINLVDLLSTELSDTAVSRIKAELIKSMKKLCASVFHKEKILKLFMDIEITLNEKSLEELISLLKDISYVVMNESALQYQKLDQFENDRLKKKKKTDKDILETFNENVFSAVDNSNKRIKNYKESCDDPLLEASRRVGDALSIEIKNPGKDIHEIAQNNSFTIREIQLNRDIFGTDIGPVLGFLKENNNPVAILTKGSGKYQAYDSTNKKSWILTKKQMEEMFSKIYMFYRLFPNEPISIKEFLKFAYDSISKKDIIYIILAGFIGGLLSTSVPIATGLLFNNIIPEGNKFSLTGLGLVLLSITISSVLFKYIQFLSMLRIDGKVNYGLQGALWNRLLSLPIPFFGNFNPFELTIKVLGVESIKTVLTISALSSIMAIFFVLFNGILLAYYDVHLALIVYVLALVSSIFTLYFGLQEIKMNRKIIEHDGQLSGITLETINGISKIEMAGAQKRAFSRWSKEFLIKEKIEQKKERRLNILETFNSAYPIIASLIIFFAALKGNPSGFSIGTFIGFYAAYTIFFSSLIVLSQSLVAIMGIVPVFENFNDILKTLPEDNEKKAKCENIKGEIEIRNLSFKYNENGPIVLDDISLNIKEGEYVAIVGFSGSGKSTLLRILLGFENYKIGKVYYDKYDMEKTDIRSIRKKIGVVLQNGKLMSGSIYSNIIGANTMLTIEDANEASKQAGLYDDIQNLPMGMHTFVSEESSGLSGGQVQKILIARAIANNPKIIFFDEATSALDNKAQNTISRNMKLLSATRVVIAHRLSTIKQCDKIFVMEKGRIVEEGSFDELLNRNGRFTDLIKRQL